MRCITKFLFLSFLLFGSIGYAVGQPLVSKPNICARVTGVAPNDVLYIREQPDHRSAIMGFLDPDDRDLRIRSCVEDGQSTWCNLETRNRLIPLSGWVNARFIEEIDCQRPGQDDPIAATSNDSQPVQRNEPAAAPQNRSWGYRMDAFYGAEGADNSLLGGTCCVTSAAEAVAGAPVRREPSEAAEIQYLASELDPETQPLHLSGCPHYGNGQLWLIDFRLRQ